MQSFGIRFGQGFDKANIIKLMHGVKVERDYDFVVIGSSPGGVACAIEASTSGRRTALIKYKYVAQEDYEDSIEDVEPPSEILGEHSSEPSHSDVTTKQNSPLKIPKKKQDGSAQILQSSPILKNLVNQKNELRSNTLEAKSYWSAKKLRKSNLDLRNELFKRGRQGRKLMLQAANLQHTLENARNFGWRIPLTVESLGINWNKLSDYVMDHIMKENWMLMNMLALEQVEVIEGTPAFVDDHTVQIHYSNGAINNITADIICLALSSEYIIPTDVAGANEFGITCDDFIRLGESPKSTLIVGGTPEGLECAAIIACCGIPVTVISRTKLLKRFDGEMTRLLINDLRGRGVVFLEYTTLESISHKKEGKLVAKIQLGLSEEDKSNRGESREFDTVIFATGKRTSYEFLRLRNAGLDQNLEFESLKTNLDGSTAVANIYAIDDLAGGHSQGQEISEVAGRILGKKLFHNATEVMDYTFIPFAVFTPVEYACVGMAEETAMYKFGKECIAIHQFVFTPFKLSMSGTPVQSLVKAVVYKTKDLIIGLHIFGPEAGEVIQGFAAALKLGLTMSKLQGLIGIQGTTAQKITQLGHSIKR